MSKGRTEFVFRTNLNKQDNKLAVESWLNSNGFKQATDKEGYSCYLQGGSVTGYRWLDYRVEDGLIEIEAWVTNNAKGKTERNLDNKFVGALGTTPYKMFIENFGKNVSNYQNQQQYRFAKENNQQYNSNQKNNIVDKISSDSDKRNSYFAIGAFTASLIFLFLTIFQVVGLGALGALICIGVAIPGLNSSKKALSIAAIVIAILDFIITVASVILQLL